MGERFLKLPTICFHLGDDNLFASSQNKIRRKTERESVFFCFKVKKVKVVMGLQPKRQLPPIFCVTMFFYYDRCLQRFPTIHLIAVDHLSLYIYRNIKASQWQYVVPLNIQLVPLNIQLVRLNKIEDWLSKITWCGRKTACQKLCCSSGICQMYTTAFCQK